MRTLLTRKVQDQLSILETFYLTEYKNHLTPGSMGVLSGLGGVILLQSIFLETTKKKQFKDEINKNLISLIETIEQDSYSMNTFCDGLAGIGWLFHYLNKRKIIDVDINSFLEDMDSVLEVELEQMIIDNNYDILHGALGLGLYFLKRNKYSIIERLINSLDQNKQTYHDEIMWKRFENNYHEAYIYDLGLAHGNSSIIYFLCKCFQKKYLPDVSLKLIKGLINFYSANIQDIEQYGSYFPNEILVDSYKTLNSYSNSRLAWCYGDLGILHTLILASRCIKDEPSTKKFISLLLNTKNRKTQIQTGAKDACFCHGSSGNAYLFLNLYKIINHKELEEATIYWINETVSFGSKSGNNLEFLFLHGIIEPGKTPINLLTGLGGVSLAFLGYLNSNTKSTWNEVFFLS